MDQETFEKELAICQKLAKKNNGKCAWGECANCGVVPLLYKLGKDEFYEKEDDIKALKEKVLQIK